MSVSACASGDGGYYKLVAADFTLHLISLGFSSVVVHLENIGIIKMYSWLSTSPLANGPSLLLCSSV